MKANYELDAKEPPGVEMEAVLDREEGEPKGYGKRLYAKAKRIYCEAKESFERDDEQGREKYDALVGISMMAIGLATGSGGLALLGALIDAIGIGWGLGGLGEYYASFTVSDREDGKKAVGRGGLL